LGSDENKVTGTDDEIFQKWQESAANDIENYEKNGVGTQYEDKLHPERDNLRTPNGSHIPYDNNKIYSKIPDRDWDVNMDGGGKRFVPK